MKSWNAENIERFVDDNETEFIKGPHEIDGKTYDYKLIDKEGEDYCTIEQMEIWDVNVTKTLRSE